MMKFHRLFIGQHLKPVFKIERQVLIMSKSSSKCHINAQRKISATQIDKIRLNLAPVQFFHTGTPFWKQSAVDEVEEHDYKKSLMYYKEFERLGIKNKKAFLETVKIYKKNVKNRASHVDFIKAALKHMKDYGVHRDLESYKKLLDVLPKGVYICTNKFLADGMYFPRQQFVTMELLEQMGNYGVAPDVELGQMLINVFGIKSHPFRIFEQQLYWSAKWKNKSPFVLPRPLPSDPLQLAKLAIDRITSVDLQTEVSVFQTDIVQDSIDKTWIVSAQSPKQKKLLKKHSNEAPVIVEGGDVVHLADKIISYFVLKADRESLPFIPPEDIDDISNIKSKFFNPDCIIKDEGPTVHEQDDGIIYAVCATGTSSKDSLLSWVRILEKSGNPVLSDVAVLFRFKQLEKLPAISSVQKEN